MEGFQSQLKERYKNDILVKNSLLLTFVLIVSFNYFWSVYVPGWKEG